MKLFLTLPPAAAIAAGAVSALLIAFYFVLFARALAPRRGTLEWISMYDRPGLQLSGAAAPLGLRSLPLCAVSMALCAGLWLLASCLQLRSFLLFTVPLGRVMLLTGAGIAALTAAGCFCLLQSLFGARPISFCGALLLGLDFSGDPAGVCLAVWALFFLHRWCCTDFERPAVDSFGTLAAFEACIVLGVSAVPAMAPMAAVLGIFLLLGLALRFHGTHRADRGRQLALTAAFAAVCFYLLLLIVRLFLELEDSADLGVLLTGGFYLRAVTGWCTGLTLQLPQNLAAINPVLLAGGLIATGFSLFAAWRYGRAEGLLLAFAVLGGTAVWLLTGVYLLPAALIPAVCCTFVSFLRRGCRGFAACGIACSFVTAVLSALALLGAL